MLGYLLWRVAKGKVSNIEFNFLVAGHTKFCCDACFGLIKKKTRVTRITSLQEICDVWFAIHLVCVADSD